MGGDKRPKNIPLIILIVFGFSIITFLVIFFLPQIINNLGEESDNLDEQTDNVQENEENSNLDEQTDNTQEDICTEDCISQIPDNQPNNTNAKNAKNASKYINKEVFFSF